MKKSTFTLLFLSMLSTLFAQNWTPMAAGLLPNNVIIYSISAVGDQVVWAIASEQFNGPPIPNTHRPIILRSSDGGQNWVVKQIEEAAGTIAFRIVAEDSLSAWITTQDYGGGPGNSLYKTTDGGEVWNKKWANIGAGVALDRFSDGKHWLAHNRQFICLTENEGANWVNGNITGYETEEYQLLFSGSNISTTAGDTLWNGTSAGRIVRFTEYGQSFTFLNTGLGTGSTILSIAFQDHLNGLLFYRSIIGASKIAKTSDGGLSWANLQTQPGIGSFNIAAVPGAPGSYALATNTSILTGKIAITKDFGASWTVETLGTSLNAIAFTSPTSGWAGGGRIASSAVPALYKYTGAPVVGTEVPKETLIGFSVNPNPVQDLLQFDFEGIHLNDRALISLTNSAGQLVFQRETTDKQLDISSLQAGVYFLKVETSKGWAVRKIIRE